MFEEVDLSDVKLVKEFGVGCLVIKGAHLWPLSHLVWESSAQHVGVTFFGDEVEPWDKANLLRIEVFKLPAAKAKLADRIEWYTRDRKKRRIKISDGELFHEDMLHVKAFKSDWERDSLALSKSEIIQIYQSKKFAVIFRFLAKSGTMLDHPIFKRVVKKVTIDPSQWEKAVPDIVDTTPKSKRTSESALSEEAEQELWAAVGSVMKRLKLSKVKEGAARMAIIQEEIDTVRTRKLNEDQRADLAIELGSFIGQLFCWELDWEWRDVREPDGTERVAVVNKNRSLAIDPIRWTHDLITDKKRPSNCLLTYNMVEAGRLPPSRPNAYAWIG